MPSFGPSVGTSFATGQWTPFLLSNLAVFIRADLGVTLVGGDVQSVVCQKSGVTFSAASAGKRPAFSAAGGPGSRPAFDFNNVATESLNSGGTVAHGATQFHWAVINQHKETVDQQIWSCAGVLNLAEPVRSSKLSWYNAGAGIVDSLQATQAGAQILAWYARSKTVTFYRNWSQVAEITIGGGTNVVSVGSYDSFLGSAMDAAGWFDGLLCEYGIMSAAPTTEILTHLSQYTRSRYGI